MDASFIVRGSLRSAESVGGLGAALDPWTEGGFFMTDSPELSVLLHETKRFDPPGDLAASANAQSEIFQQPRRIEQSLSGEFPQ